MARKTSNRTRKADEVPEVPKVSEVPEIEDQNQSDNPNESGSTDENADPTDENTDHDDVDSDDESESEDPRVFNIAGSVGDADNVISNAQYENIYPFKYKVIDEHRILVIEEAFYRFTYPGSTRAGRAVAYPAGAIVSADVLDNVMSDESNDDE